MSSRSSSDTESEDYYLLDSKMTKAPTANMSEGSIVCSYKTSLKNQNYWEAVKEVRDKQHLTRPTVEYLLQYYPQVVNQQRLRILYQSDYFNLARDPALKPVPPLPELESGGTVVTAFRHSQIHGSPVHWTLASIHFDKGPGSKDISLLHYDPDQNEGRFKTVKAKMEAWVANKCCGRRLTVAKMPGPQATLTKDTGVYVVLGAAAMAKDSDRSVTSFPSKWGASSPRDDLLNFLKPPGKGDNPPVLSPSGDSGVCMDCDDSPLASTSCVSGTTGKATPQVQIVNPPARSVSTPQTRLSSDSPTVRAATGSKLTARRSNGGRPGIKKPGTASAPPKQRKSMPLFQNSAQDQRLSKQAVQVSGAPNEGNPASSGARGNGSPVASSGAHESSGEKSALVPKLRPGFSTQRFQLVDDGGHHGTDSSSEADSDTEAEREKRARTESYSSVHSDESEEPVSKRQRTASALSTLSPSAQATSPETSLAKMEADAYLAMLVYAERTKRIGSVELLLEQKVQGEKEIQLQEAKRIKAVQAAMAATEHHRTVDSEVCKAMEELESFKGNMSKFNQEERDKQTLTDLALVLKPSQLEERRVHMEEQRTLLNDVIEMNRIEKKQALWTANSLVANAKSDMDKAYSLAQGIETRIADLRSKFPEHEKRLTWARMQAKIVEDAKATYAELWG
ncbi:hypothetical protein FZEAL_168 [Fusarium zealandicum]|uniref:Uncharacterized protein n=1 Tax=Fusarium zealandicum TaxID=1053134 RepID=A0A8H4UVF9_9HYPO|nr:hypothetical protein FZEAL_168 [Fusarium zealandicum]